MAALIKATAVTSGVDADIKSTESGTLISIDQRVVWTAKGYGFQAMATAAVAALVVRPGTTAIATLRNNSPTTNLVIDEAFAHNLVTTTAQGFSNIWLCSHPAGMAAVTNDITVRNSMNGQTAGGSVVSFDNGATVLDDGWFPWPDVTAQAEETGALPGAVALARVYGRIIVPPTGGISASVVSSVTGNTFTVGFRWYEVPNSEFNNT